MSTQAVTVSRLTKRFSGVAAVSDVSFDVRPGEVRALIGENGSGKSTIIKVLSGYHTPDPESEVVIGGHRLEFGTPKSAYNLGARFVHQDLGLIDSESVLDNLMLTSGYPTTLGSISRRRARARGLESLERVGLGALDLGRIAADLSAAEKTGVAIARALLRRPGDHDVRLVVLDEPTATLPEDEVQQLLEVVRRVADSGIAVIYVTHHLDEVFAIAESVTVMRDGRAIHTGLVRDLDRSKLVHLLLGSELDDVRHVSEAREVEDGSAPLLEVVDLVAEDLEQVSLKVRPGEIVGVAGLDGSGRDALCGAIYGAARRSGGSVSIAGRKLPGNRPDSSVRQGMVYLPPDRKRFGAFMDLTARENLTVGGPRAFWRVFRLSSKLEKAEARKWFEHLDIRPTKGYDNDFRSFSGGNQQKILFAKWLRLEPAILLLDEPTQGVDIGAKARIHKEILARADQGVGVVVSSSDVDELAAISTRVLVMRDNKIVASLRNADANTISRQCIESQQGVK